MSFLEKLTAFKPPLLKAEQTVANLESTLAEARAWSEQCDQELEAALLGEVEGWADLPTVKKARAAAADAHQTVSDMQKALEGARRRIGAAIADASAAEDLKRRKQLGELAEQRLSLGLRFQKIAVEIAAVVDQSEEIAAEIFRLLPGSPDVAATLTSRADLHAAMREQLCRVGAVPWSPGPLSPWELERRPDLASRIEQANVVALGG
jgi:hypothetical protein